MSEEASAWGFPGTGAAIERRSLVEVLATWPQVVKVLAAPSGYGKTILAAQFARAGGFGTALWVDIGRSVRAEGSLISVVLERIRKAADQQGTSHPEVRVQDAPTSVLASLEPFASGGRRVCIIIDDVDMGNGSMLSTDLALLELAMSSLRGNLVVTTRDEDCSLRGLRSVQCLDLEDLRLSRHEGREIASLIEGRDVPQPEADSLWEVCGGHAAFFAVLARRRSLLRAGADGDDHHSYLDLNGQLARVISSELSVDEQRTLNVMCMLGFGSPEQLQSLGVRSSHLDRIGAVLPLVSVPSEGDAGFRVHDLLRSYVLRPDSLWTDSARLVERVVEHLSARGDAFAAADLVSRLFPAEKTVEWLNAFGQQALTAGAFASTDRMLSGLSLADLIDRPRLLLLQASILASKGSLEEAATKARVVVSIASSSRDMRLALDALRLSASVYSNSGQMRLCRETLLTIVNQYASTMTTKEYGGVYALLATLATYEGGVEDAQDWLSKAELLMEEKGLTGAEALEVLGNQGACASMVRGRADEAARYFAHLAGVPTIGRFDRVRALGNAAAYMLEIGSLDRCIEYCGQAIRGAQLYGFPDEQTAFEPILGIAQVSAGEVQTGLGQIEGVLHRESADGSFNNGVDWSRVYYATTLRAVGRNEKSLYEAERALEGLERKNVSLLSSAAELEVACSMLALDDPSLAVRLTTAALRRIDPQNLYQQLRAAMILAEIDVSAGNVKEAADRLRSFRDYVLTGSSNWQIAMYVRAFPDLIAPLALGIGVKDLPVRMLRMILPENAERSLTVTRDLLAEEEWRSLGGRLLGPEEFQKWIDREGRPLCRVRMFGGFEVTVGQRSISEKDWKKRKARALFAILAARNGQAVTRDQLCEHLWPHMDDARARNNLYVAWSVMKSALVGLDAKSGECPYIEAVGGLCRTVAGAVRTDVDEFGKLLSEARVAQSSGDTARAISSYERVADLYRGELLPGDLYDDWFQAMRDRYRHEFCDAMLRGSDLALCIGDSATALQFARRGLGADPFREDLYQAALRAQISAGQRSSAIETYFECRSRLIDELGLDPSSETRALYEQVLALEDGPAQALPWASWSTSRDDGSGAAGA